ncbi:hypothetical protein V6R21_17895 [Limibacter armeniacum]|uniref:hypothetical protein n=1 Tax=Limibacter armeniacum TaxID=466084 RepID=UPI002FE54B72
MNNQEVAERLKELGIKLYGLKELEPLHRQVCTTLSNIVSNGHELLGAAWVLAVHREGQAVGMVCIIQDKLLFIAGIPAKGKMISEEYPFETMTDLSVALHPVTHVTEAMKLHAGGFELIMKGLKGFIPSDFVKTLQELEKCPLK